MIPLHSRLKSDRLSVSSLFARRERTAAVQWRGVAFARNSPTSWVFRDERGAKDLELSRLSGSA